MFHRLTEVGAFGVYGILGIKAAAAIRRAATRGMLRAVALGLVRVIFWLGVLAASLWASDRAVSLWVVSLAHLAHRYLAHPGG